MRKTRSRLFVLQLPCYQPQVTCHLAQDFLCMCVFMYICGYVFYGCLCTCEHVCGVQQQASFLRNCPPGVLTQGLLVGSGTHQAPEILSPASGTSYLFSLRAFLFFFASFLLLPNRLPPHPAQCFSSMSPWSCFQT